jgi:hypothetical protein
VMITCDPPGYPTTSFIQDHPEPCKSPFELNKSHAANSKQMQTPTSQAGATRPTNGLKTVLSTAAQHDPPPFHKSIHPVHTNLTFSLTTIEKWYDLIHHT